MNDHRRFRFSKKETIRAVERVLRREKKRVSEVSVVYTSSQRIRTMNAEYLNHDFVTDVIAFELEPSPALEGEIYVNLDRARIQAREYGATVVDETRRLLIHGLLHILGYDDATPRGKGRMTREEDAVIRLLKSA